MLAASPSPSSVAPTSPPPSILPDALSVLLTAAIAVLPHKRGRRRSSRASPSSVAPASPPPPHRHRHRFLLPSSPPPSPSSPTALLLIPLTAPRSCRHRSSPTPSSSSSPLPSLSFTSSLPHCRPRRRHRRPPPPALTPSILPAALSVLLRQRYPPPPRRYRFKDEQPAARPWFWGSPPPFQSSPTLPVPRSTAAGLELRLCFFIFFAAHEYLVSKQKIHYLLYPKSSPSATGYILFSNEF